MTTLTVFAILVLGATAALISWSFMIGRATKAPERELDAELDAEAQQTDGPDKRAGGAEFRAEALRAAHAPPQKHARRRRVPGRRRHPLRAEPETRADLTADPER